MLFPTQGTRSSDKDTSAMRPVRKATGLPETARLPKRSVARRSVGTHLTP